MTPGAPPRTRDRVAGLVRSLREAGVDEGRVLALTRKDPGALRRALRERREGPRRPSAIPFDQPHPALARTHPGHPEFMPDITTRATFNAHMAQAVAPYVTAIAEKVAQERGLTTPDADVLRRVLEKVDWTRAAYELRGMGKKPPPSRIRRFLGKYVFEPADKAVSDLFLKRVWPRIVSLQTMMLMFAALSTYSKRWAAPAAAIAKAHARRALRTPPRSYTKALGLRSPSRLRALGRALSRGLRK